MPTGQMAGITLKLKSRRWQDGTAVVMLHCGSAAVLMNAPN